MLLSHFPNYYLQTFDWLILASVQAYCTELVLVKLPRGSIITNEFLLSTDIARELKNLRCPLIIAEHREILIMKTVKFWRDLPRNTNKRCLEIKKLSQCVVTAWKLSKSQWRGLCSFHLALGKDRYNRVIYESSFLVLSTRKINAKYLTLTKDYFLRI